MSVWKWRGRNVIFVGGEWLVFSIEGEGSKGNDNYSTKWLASKDEVGKEFDSNGIIVWENVVEGIPCQFEFDWESEVCVWYRILLKEDNMTWGNVPLTLKIIANICTLMQRVTKRNARDKLEIKFGIVISTNARIT